MKSLFDETSYNELMNRINVLTPQTQRQWGKMDVAQMMAHCSQAFKIPLSNKPVPRMFIGRLIGWALKKQLYNETPYKKGLPTSPDFIIKEQKNFDKEKIQLVELLTKFYQLGPDKLGNFPHPFFGYFTKTQWGQGMYKHVDHHLQQFGA